MSLEETITLRCDKVQFKKFIEWCAKIGKKHPDLLRELMEAGPENRLTITPKKGQIEKLKELYKGV